MKTGEGDWGLGLWIRFEDLDWDCELGLGLELEEEIGAPDLGFGLEIGIASWN